MNRMTQAGHLYQIIGGATPTDRELAAVPGLASHEPTPPGSDGAVITALPQAHWRPGAKLFLVENGSDGDIDAAETMETRIRKALTAAQLVKHNIFTKGVHYADTGVVAVSGTAKLFATGDCVVYATGQAEVIASGEVRVFACDRVTGSCRISVKLEAGGNSVFHIYGHSTAKASESAHVIGHNNTVIEAADKSRVDLYDFAKAEGGDDVTIRGYNKARIKAAGKANVRTNDQSKAWIDGHSVGHAADNSQIFVGPQAKARRNGFAQIRPLQVEYIEYV